MGVQDVLAVISKQYPGCPVSSPELARRWLEQRMDDLSGPRLEHSEGLWNTYWSFYLAWCELTRAITQEAVPAQQAEQSVRHAAVIRGDAEGATG